MIFQILMLITKQSEGGIKVILKYSPQRRDNTLTIIKAADTLTINGTVYDFTNLLNGETLPQEAIDCEFICGDVERTNGELIIPILLPLKRGASQLAKFPDPVTINTDGQVVLPR